MNQKQDCNTTQHTNHRTASNIPLVAMVMLLIYHTAALVPTPSVEPDVPVPTMVDTVRSGAMARI
jgi:hypothetical protein